MADDLHGRSPTRTESAEELRALAGDLRAVAEQLRVIYEHAQRLSNPVYMSGWTRPIASARGFAGELEGWADRLDALVREPFEA